MPDRCYSGPRAPSTRVNSLPRKSLSGLLFCVGTKSYGNVRRVIANLGTGNAPAILAHNQRNKGLLLLTFCVVSPKKMADLPAAHIPRLRA
jgi:hypothetical protein